MMTHNTGHGHAMNDGAAAAATMTRTQVIDILSLGATTASRPIDFVIERLNANDGARKIAEDIESRFDVDINSLAQGDMPLESLRTIKDEAKAAFDEHSGDVGAVALYFLAVSAGLAAHRINLSSRSGAEIVETLIDFGEACPAPWRAMVRSAVLNLADLGDES